MTTPMKTTFFTLFLSLFLVTYRRSFPGTDRFASTATRTSQVTRHERDYGPGIPRMTLPTAVVGKVIWKIPNQGVMAQRKPQSWARVSGGVRRIRDAERKYFGS